MQKVIDIPDFLYNQILKRHVSKRTIAKIFEKGVELPKGTWDRQTNDYVDYYCCSNCGMAVGIYDVKNYCPNCGAKMDVEEK